MEGIIVLMSKDDLKKTISESLQAVLKEHNNASTVVEDVWFDKNQLIEYLPQKPTISTIYTWVKLRKIPYHKTGGKLIFLKSEIDTWLHSGKKKTVEEASDEAQKK